MKMLISERFARTARTGGVLALVGVLAWGCVMAAPSAVFADDPAGLKAELEAASSKLDAMYETRYRVEAGRARRGAGRSERKGGRRLQGRGSLPALDVPRIFESR